MRYKFIANSNVNISNVVKRMLMLVYLSCFCDFPSLSLLPLIPFPFSLPPASFNLCPDTQTSTPPLVS